jgi:hypothetical protein
MAKLKFDNKLKPVKNQFDFEGSGIKLFKDFKTFGSMFDKALEGKYDPSEEGYDKFLAYDPESKTYIAVDNTSGELFTEEFNTEEEAYKYLSSDYGTGEDFKNKKNK